MCVLSLLIAVMRGDRTHKIT